MIRVIGRVCHPWFGTCTLTMENASDAAKVRPGDMIRFTPYDNGEHERRGWHHVTRTNVETGVIEVRDPVHEITPAACDRDWIVTDAIETSWSPYP